MYDVHVETRERFWSKVSKTDGCWLWTGARTSNGYGNFWLDGSYVGTHRWAYEQEHGPIPHDLVLDHLCRRRECVRPSHLEAVTQRQNLMRGTGMSVVNAAKAACLRGHEFTPDNTMRLSTRPGDRICRECKRIRRAADKARQRA